jgi:hypothetical protein
MNEPKQPPSSLGNNGADVQSTAAGPDCAGSAVVFSGDPAEVRAGFVIALKLMGIVAPMPEPCAGDPTKQDP